MKDNRIAAVVVAAGSGQRMNTESYPKQYIKINGKNLINHAVDAFVNHKKIDKIIIAINPQDQQLFNAAIPQADYPTIISVAGGKERQNSVCNALEALEQYDPKYVLIHDAARPFLSKALIDRVIKGLELSTGVIPALPITDAIKRIEKNRIVGNVGRSGLYTAQTPQGFVYRDILMCHRLSKFSLHVDDSSLLEAYNLPVTIVLGDYANVKITNAEDLKITERVLQ
ncbi:2-C-methyl-D-erythritol 4-phosphate cytidylyltransferase [Candidatus Xenohaliotis californiensis]|uniref:2-C-methyl-D-erythritol 4-phosphate cytidylyltransferase n=1 Tax=Candidatus Xenohaliotis californiensis TaxID=84677 RepID=UPI0030C7F4FE